MKIAICQINTIIGDFRGNAERIRRDMAWAAAAGADLAVFPELTVCGYPPRDLLEKPLFIRRTVEAVGEIAQAARELGAVIGYARPNETDVGRPLFNAAALVHDGTIVFTQDKSLLPAYDVFDETRHFTPAEQHRVCRFRDATFALSLCEDIWSDYAFEGRRLYESDPIGRFVELGAEFIINISASPYTLGKHAVRTLLATRTARRFARPVIYCNLVGGNDELIFDGQSMVVDASGQIVWQGKRFEEDRTVIDLEALPKVCAVSPRDEIGEIRQALALGIRDYMRKCGFERALIGLSGGVDSAVVTALACDAVGANNVTAVIMPSPYTAQASMDDAHAVAAALGIVARVIPIDRIYDAYRETLNLTDERRTVTVAEENLQARARGNILLAISNREGHLVLSTGNKSELAVGYCTLYGDMAGGLAAISDIPKTMVYELARRYHAEGVIPSSVIDKAPSAELKPDQTDQDSLPSYDILDEILKLSVEENLGSDAIIERGYDAAVVKRVVTMIALNEYKRRQAPPGLKVTSKAFGSGRRYPIARKMYW